MAQAVAKRPTRKAVKAIKDGVTVEQILQNEDQLKRFIKKLRESGWRVLSTRDVKVRF